MFLYVYLCVKKAENPINIERKISEKFINFCIKLIPLFCVIIELLKFNKTSISLFYAKFINLFISSILFSHEYFQT